MIVDITNEILTEVKNALVGINVLAPYPELVIEPPTVTIEEKLNNTYIPTIDSSGQNHSQITIEINIFTNGSTRINDAKAIRNDIDAIVSDDFGLTRMFSDTIPNFADKSIYRYIMRYDCVVDKNKKIYRR